MARFPDAELDRIKRETDLLDLVRRGGVELKRHGADWLGLCPLHPDRSPSLVVSPAKGLWHCLGACQSGGTAIDWVMRLEQLTFREAVAKLQRELVSAPPVPPRAPKRQAAAAAAATTPLGAALPEPRSAEDQALLDRVATIYQESLQASPAALGYLGQRGLRDEEAITHFRIGFADGTLLARLPRERGRLEGLGLVTDQGQELLASCVVVPILSLEGAVLNLYGRKIEDRNTKGFAKHLYLPGTRRGVFHLAGLREATEVILCEAIFDALTFWVHGFRNVTTSYGVNGFPAELHQALYGYGIERVLLAYDRDDTGEKAAAALAKKLGAAGLGCYRVHFPRGMDANAYALQVTPARESLVLALRSAAWVAGPPPQPAEKAASKQRSQPPVGVVAEPEPEAFCLAAASAASPVLEPATVAAEREVPPVAVAAGSGLDPFDLTLGDRRYRVRGLTKNLAYEKLQVLVRVACGERFFVDSVDLVSSRQRVAFVKQAAIELGVKPEVLQTDLAKLHLDLELLQDQRIAVELQTKQPKTPTLSSEAEREALAYLQRPDLLTAILADFERCGVVGEETNKLVGYLVAISRKLNRPLAAILQSSSAAGKSALLDAILALVPEEERVQYSAMTGQSLFYMSEASLEHKVLAIAEEEGAERASYALKLLQSEGELTIASTGKDPQSGKLVTHEYRVKGPVAILLTTTAIDIDEELLNRCIVLTVDEDREQTRAIHRRQREAETLAGLLAERRRARTLELHRNVQRLLQPVAVINPYAKRLTFLDDRARTRRDHMKYLTLIRTIALLHQYQRPRRIGEDGAETVEYIEATLDDIAVANRLASEALGRSLDELPPQSRRFLEQMHAWVKDRTTKLAIDQQTFLFSRRSVIEATGMSLTQARLHLDRLVEHEYLLLHRAARGQGFVYELLWNGEGLDGRAFVMGLLDVEKLAQSPRVAEEMPGVADFLEGVAESNGQVAGGWRADSGGVAAGWRRPRNGSTVKRDSGLREVTVEISPAALLRSASHA